MLDERVNLIELTAPECMLVQDGRVSSNRCFQMRLGEKDDSGRPRPIRIEGSEFELQADSVITAIGQRVNADFFPDGKLEIDPVSHETQISNVFAGGDAARGASTLINAIGDGKHVAESIISRAAEERGIDDALFSRTVDLNLLRVAKGRRQPGTPTPEIGFDERSGFTMVINTLDEQTAREEAARCLLCDEICSVCVSVCPNRANVEFQMEPLSYTVQRAVKNGSSVDIVSLGSEQISQKYQIINLGDFCNECGNCATFCPTSGAPYQDKPKFHISEESYNAAVYGYWFSAENRLEYKNNGEHAVLQTESDGFSYEDQDCRAVLNSDYSVYSAEIKTGKNSVDMQRAVLMAVLSQTVGGLDLFTMVSRGD